MGAVTVCLVSICFPVPIQMNLRATTCHFRPGESRDIITTSQQTGQSRHAVPHYRRCTRRRCPCRRRFIYLRADSPRPVRGLHRQVVIRFLLGVQGPRHNQGSAGLAHVKAAVIITTCGVRRRGRQRISCQPLPARSNGDGETGMERKH